MLLNTNSVRYSNNMEIHSYLFVLEMMQSSIAKLAVHFHHFLLPELVTTINRLAAVIYWQTRGFDNIHLKEGSQGTGGGGGDIVIMISKY